MSSLPRRWPVLVGVCGVCVAWLAASARVSVTVACDRMRSGCLRDDAIARAWEDGNLTAADAFSVRAPNARPTFEAWRCDSDRAITRMSCIESATSRSLGLGSPSPENGIADKDGGAFL